MSVSTTHEHEEENLTLGPALPYAMGRFTLCEELGSGGMATVYLSKMKLAAGLDRLVAVKTIHKHLAKEQTFVDMFLDEAKIASHISHPNVSAVYDFGNVGGIYYIAMEYLVGEPLIEFVNAVAAREDQTLLEALPFLAARIIADACEGLHAAHTLRGADGKRLEVIHRDVSPQNLFVTYEGSTKVVDFGCAKALERVTQTNTGIMKGKVSYAAPEQLNGDSLDARADVFALGICLWETLTMRQLFRRDNAIKTAMAVLEEPIPRADDEYPWVPTELADIASRALARDVEDRYRTARELGKALRGFIARSGAPFEAAEVADWMRHLFAERHEMVLARVAEVEGFDTSVVAPVGHEPEPIELARTAVAKPKVGAPEENVWDSHDSGASGRAALRLPEQIEDEDPVVLPTRTGGYIAAFVIVALLIGGAVYGWVFHRPQVMGLFGMGEGSASGQDDTEEPQDVTPLEDPSTEGDAPEDEASGAVDPEEGQPEEEGVEEAGDATAEEPSSATEAREEVEAAAPSTGDTRARRPRRGGDEQSSEDEEDESDLAPAPEIDYTQGPVYVRTSGGGWAEVFFEGRSLGRTPVRARLPVGRQTIRVVPMGDESRARDVSVNVEWGGMPTITVPIDAE